MGGYKLMASFLWLSFDAKALLGDAVPFSCHSCPFLSLGDSDSLHRRCEANMHTKSVA